MKGIVTLKYEYFPKPFVVDKNLHKNVHLTTLGKTKGVYSHTTGLISETA